MLLLRRLSVCLITAITLFLGGQIVYAITVGCADNDTSGTAISEYLQCMREADEVATMREEMDARRAMKVAIAREVSLEQLTLVEAIAQFRELFPEGVDQMMPGRNDDERLGLCIIRFVGYQLHDLPSQRATMIPQLERELARHLDELEKDHRSSAAVH